MKLLLYSNFEHLNHMRFFPTAQNHFSIVRNINLIAPITAFEIFVHETSSKYTHGWKIISKTNLTLKFFNGDIFLSLTRLIYETLSTCLGTIIGVQIGTSSLYK